METGIRVLSVETWRAFALSGVHVPVRLTVTGNSMRPLIRPNRDVVTMLPPSRPPRPGDIVLFPSPGNGGGYVLHRVVKARGELVKTMGDNCNRPDGWMRAGEICGIAVSIRRGERTVNPATLPMRGLGLLWIWSHHPRKLVLSLLRAVRARLTRSSRGSDKR